MQYFVGIEGAVNLRKRYLELVKQHHPDKGGDVKTMQEINRQYEDAKQFKIKGSSAYGYYRNSSTSANSGFGFEDLFRQYKRRQYTNVWDRFEEALKQQHYKEEQRLKTKAERFESYVQTKGREYIDKFFLSSREEILEELGKLYRDWIRIREYNTFK